jgi:hypothetical protein
MKRLFTVAVVLGCVIAAGCGDKAPSGSTKGGDSVKDETGSGTARFINAAKKAKGQAEVKKDKAGKEYLLVQFHRGTDDDLGELRKALADAPMPVDINANFNGELSDAGLAHLKGWKNLIGLGVGSPKFTDAGFANLADLDCLESLYIYHTDELSNACLQSIAKLTSLRVLWCESKKMTRAAYAAVSGLSKLEKVRLGANNEVGDAELADLARFHQLRELQIGGLKISDAGLGRLNDFPELRELNINVWPDADKNVTSKGLANLSGLAKLEKLTLRSGAAKEDLSALKNLTALREFTFLTMNGPKPGVIASVAQLPNLKTLSFGGYCILDDGLKGLEGAKYLETLDLAGGNDRFGDDGCKIIAKIPNLKSLNLSSTGVTDAGLAHLKGMTGLRELRIGSTKTTPAGIAELKKALPNTKIET